MHSYDDILHMKIYLFCVLLGLKAKLLCVIILRNIPVPL